MIYRARFPEDLWRVAPNDLKRYNQETERGYEILKQKRLLVCGITRNTPGPLIKNLERIKYLGSLCRNLSTIIYCNDDPETKSILENSNTNYIYEELGNKFHGSVVTSERYKDMAGYRNKYLVAARNEDFDYMVVLDLDTHGFSYDGVANSLYHFNENTDFIGSNGLIYNGRKLFYDSLAFRKKYTRLTPTEINLLDYNRGEPLIKVESCFGGLGIYNKKILEYSYQDDDCDHVTINRNLNCFLNPSMIVLYSENPYET